jgi:hypothetical protein
MSSLILVSADHSRWRTTTNMMSIENNDIAMLIVEETYLLNIIKASESIAYGSFHNDSVIQHLRPFMRAELVYYYAAISNGPRNDVEGNWRRCCPQFLTHVETASSFITHTKFYLTSE